MKPIISAWDTSDFDLDLLPTPEIDPDGLALLQERVASEPDAALLAEALGWGAL